MLGYDRFFFFFTCLFIDFVLEGEEDVPLVDISDDNNDDNDHNNENIKVENQVR
jgi:hypothetical protein